MWQSCITKYSVLDPYLASLGPTRSSFTSNGRQKRRRLHPQDGAVAALLYLRSPGAVLRHEGKEAVLDGRPEGRLLDHILVAVQPCEAVVPGWRL